MKKRLLTTVNLSLFIGLVSLSPSSSYGVRATTLKQIEGVVGGPLTPAELAQVDAFYVQTGHNVHKTAHLILEQQRADREGHHLAIHAANAGQIRNLQRLLQNAHQEIDRLTRVNHQLAAHADEAIRHARELIHMLDQERGAHARTTQQLHLTDAHLRDVQRQLLNSTVHAQREIEALRQALGEARGGNAELQEAIRQLQAQLADSQRNYQEVAAALINIAKATFVWKDRMTPAAAERAIIQSFQREIQSAGEWQALYLQTSGYLDKLWKQQHATQQELFRALAESAQLKEQLRRQVFDLAGQAEQIRRLQHEKGGLAKEAEAWKQALSEAEDSRAQLELYVNRLTAAIDQIADKLNIPRGKVGTMIPLILNKIDAYQAQFQRDQQQLEANADHIRTIEGRLQTQLGLTQDAVRDRQQADERNQALLTIIEGLREELRKALEAQKQIERELQQSALEARDKMEAEIVDLSRQLAAARRAADVAAQHAAQDRAQGEEILQEAEEARNKIKRLEAEIAFLQQGVQEIPRNMVQLNQKSLADLEQMRILVREKITFMTQLIRDRGNPQASKLKPSYEQIAALLDAAISNLEIALQKSSSGTLQSSLGVPEFSMSEAGRRLYTTPPRAGAAAVSPRTPRRQNLPGAALGTPSVVPRSLATQLSAAEGRSSPSRLHTAKEMRDRPSGSATRRLERFDPGSDEEFPY